MLHTNKECAKVRRSRIFQLKLLDEADLRRVLEQALTDSERGYGQLSVIVEPDAICASQQRFAIAHLVNVAKSAIAFVRAELS